MLNLQLINSFVKDPLTEKLFRKYVTDAKARRAFDTTVRPMEIVMVALPLVVVATKSIRDMVKPERSRSRSGLRRLMPA